VVDHAGGYYVAGELTELGAEIALTGGSAYLKGAARRLGREASEQAAQKAYAAARRLHPDIPQGAFRHHRPPLRGHPGDGAEAIFPTIGLPTWANTNRFTIRVIGDRAAHMAAHESIRQSEAALRFAIVGWGKFSGKTLSVGGRHLLWYLLDSYGGLDCFPSQTTLPVITVEE
jgi:hypothetical protein